MKKVTRALMFFALILSLLIQLAGIPLNMFALKARAEPTDTNKYLIEEPKEQEDEPTGEPDTSAELDDAPVDENGKQAEQDDTLTEEGGASAGDTDKPAEEADKPADDDAPQGEDGTQGKWDDARTDEDEMPLTLQTLTDSLSIVGIYEYVHNMIKNEFYFGSVKGVTGTFKALSGNDYDSAALLIGMLRHKGIPARYSRGLVCLTVPQARELTGTTTAEEAAKVLAAGGNPTTVVATGGRITTIRTERVWAECYVSFDKYNGTGDNTEEKSWIPLDAGFKQLDSDGSIIQEPLKQLPAALPYAIVNHLERFDTTRSRMGVNAPVIDYDIPFTMAPGEKYECTVSATSISPLTQLSVSQNGQPITLSIFGSFEFEALEYGVTVFEIEATDRKGNKAALTHTLFVTEEADMRPPELNVFIDPGEGKPGSPINIIVDANDGDGVVFVTVAVNGEQIGGQDGVYTFVPEQLSGYTIVVAATDSRGNRSGKSMTYTLASTGNWGYTVPLLDVWADMSLCYEPGDPIYIYTAATDGSGDVGVTVTVDDQKLSKSGDSYIFIPDRYGVFEILVTAANEHGNSVFMTVLANLTESCGMPDITPPELEVEIDTGGGTGIGKPIRLLVTAGDDSGNVDVEVIVNGKQLTGAERSYEFTPDKTGVCHIVVTASDPSGNRTGKKFMVNVSSSGGVVSSNLPGFALSLPDSNIYVGETANILIDTAGDSGELAVEATANGLSFPYTDGIARFTPLEPGRYDILVRVSNSAGNSAYSRFAVVAIAGTGGSNLFIVPNEGYDTVKVGEKVSVLVRGAGVSGDITLTADGVSLELNKLGEAQYTAGRAGLITLTATAVSTEGESLRAESTIRVVNPFYQSLPTATISSPTEGAEITAPTDIIGTVTGSGFAYYTLSYAKVGSVGFTVIAQGDEPKTDAVLGLFDPTILHNGYYIIRLTAYGAAGYTADEVTISVQGRMKAGELIITFRDMLLSVGNIARSYDSRDRKKQGDFGYGWNLSISEVKLSVSCLLGEYWEQVASQGDYDTGRYSWDESKIHEITVDWGNGRIEKFAMRLSPDYQDVSPLTNGITPSFVSIGNTTSKLTTLDDAKDLVYQNGTLSDSTTLETYNPTRFRLTTPDGMEYVIGVDCGVESITNTLSNTITIDRDGIHHSDGKSIAFLRDSMGRITKIIGPTEKEVTYHYDRSGNLIEVIDFAGMSTRYVYNRYHQLTEIIDPRGVRGSRYEYDDSGRRVAAVDAGGNRTVFDYDIEGRRQIITDRLGNTTLYVCDERGNILSTTDALGNTTFNEYDENGNLSAHRDALGNTTNYEYTPDGRLLSMTDALNIKLENQYNKRNELVTTISSGILMGNISYNSSGQITQKSDAMGNTTRYEYQEDGRLMSISDGIGAIMQFVYDQDGNVAFVTDGLNETTGFSYDADGNTLAKAIIHNDTNGENNTLIESYQYDLCGNVIRKIYPDGSFDSYEYDKVGNKVAETDTAGRRTTWSHDVFGNIIGINYCDNTFEAFEYDEENRVTKETDRYGQIIMMSYDEIGNQKTKTYSSGAVESYEYDAKNRLIAKIDTAGARTTYEYDAIDRNTAIADALGNRTEFTYNSMSQLSEEKDPMGYVTRYEYDLNGNRTKVYLPDGNTTVSTYNLRGMLTSQTDQNGYTTIYKYDGLDRLISVTDPLKNEWKYKYNAIGERTAVIDPNGNITSYQYDDKSRLVRITNAAGYESVNKYNGRGNLMAVVDYAGVSTNYKYDECDRITQIKVRGKTIGITYNGINQIETVTDENGTTRYLYDSMNLLMSERKPDGAKLSYEYDSAGRQTRLTSPYGAVSNTYDILGRLKTVTDREGDATTFEYDPNGNNVSVVYSNGMTTSYTYNSVGEVIGETTSDSNGDTMYKYTYTLGKLGERLKVTESVNKIVTCEYDKLYRLIRETVNENAVAMTTSYTFDAVGNRTSKTEGGFVTNYSYNNLNQLTAETGITYEYDLNGNCITKTEGLCVTAYACDEMNRLIRETMQDSQNVTVDEYKYDWKGNMIEKRCEAGFVRYLMDTNNTAPRVVAETDGGGVLQAFYTYGGDTLINMVRAGVKSYHGE